LMNSQSCCNAGSRMIWAHSPGYANWGVFYDDATDRMHWRQGPGAEFLTTDFLNQRVGIGTLIPAEKLHVAGAGVVRARINSDSNAGIRLALNEQAQWSVASVLASPEFPRGDFQVYNDRINQNALYILGLNNNVGIGTTNPHTQLTLTGSLGFTNAVTPM